MSNKKHKIFTLLVLLIVAAVFRGWLSEGTLVSGDWPYLSERDIENFSWFPEGRFLWLGLYYQWTAKIGVQVLGLGWPLTERVFWFYPFVITSFFSSRYLFKVLFPGSKLWSIASLIYVTNTYVLMMVGGGQMGVALSYSLAPLILARFISLSERIAFEARGSGLKGRNIRENSSSVNYQSLITFALLFSLQTMFDPRIAYITGIAIGVYLFMRLLTNLRVNGLKKNDSKNSSLLKNSLIYVVLVPGLIVIALNSFWLIPMLKGGGDFIENLGQFYTSIGAVKFLSFAFFENTISLLHPYWPENEFGKVGFQKPEFLILPILAYTALLFIDKKTRKHKNTKTNYNHANGMPTKQSDNIINYFFAILGLFGAFLAKGANPPFGGVYLWLFENFPGFVMFRDPTKFYILIALSYSMLIPYTLMSIADEIAERRNK